MLQTTPVYGNYSVHVPGDVGLRQGNGNIVETDDIAITTQQEVTSRASDVTAR